MSGAALNGFPKVAGYVSAAVPDGSGGWYIGGLFTSVGGVPRENLAHILADNRVAPWNPGVSDEGVPAAYIRPALEIHAIAVVGSTVYVGGKYTRLGGQPRNSIGAVDAITGIATAWNPNAIVAPRFPGEIGYRGWVNALAARGTTMYVGGVFTEIGGKTRVHLAVLDLATGDATDWRPRADGHGVYALALSDDRLYVAGDLRALEERKSIVAFDLASGNLADWNPNVDGPVWRLALNGQTVYVIGSFCNVGGQPRDGIAAIDVNTAQATSWNPVPDDFCGENGFVAIAVNNGTVYVSRGSLAALDATTALPTGWDPDLGGGVTVLAVSGGTVYAGGGPFILGGETRNSLAAIDVATGRVTPWDPNLGQYGQVSALAVSGGTVYVGGHFTNVGGEQRSDLAAIDATTGIATSWNPNPTGGFGGGGGPSYIFSIAVRGGTVYVGGVFSRMGGEERNSLAALDATTGVATPWNPKVEGPTLPEPAYSVIRTLLVSGSTIYVGGFFGAIGGQARTSIAAVDMDTGIPTSWNPSTGGYTGFYVGLVYALAQRGPTIYVGGQFNQIGGQARNNLAALSAATGLATPWDPGLSAYPASVNALAVSDQTIYAGGVFNEAGGQGRNGLAALDAKTGTARAWNPEPGGFGFSGLGSALLVRGNTVFSGGGFPWIGESPQSNLAVIEAAHGESERNGRSGAKLVSSRLDGDVAMSVLDRGREVVISYSLPEQGPARIAVFDIAGRRVATLGDDAQSAGTHQLGWDSSGLAGGLYFYRLEAGSVRITKTVLHLR